MQGSYVWVVSTDSKGVASARIQTVAVALAEGQNTILDGGVQAGQSVVVDGADRLRPGQTVIATAARQRTGQGGGQGSGQPASGKGGGQGPANPSAPWAGSQPGAPGGNPSGKQANKEKQ
jgi:hypothetical protein